MRSTVGPLPSAVYWRRRAVVLGALLLGVIVLFVSCSGGDDSKRGQGTSASQYPTPAPATDTKSASASPDDLPSFVDGQPGGGQSLPEPGDVNGQSTGGAGTGNGNDGGTGSTAGTNQNVTAPIGSACTDAEVSVIPVPASTTVKRGQPLEIHLKIKNIGSRTCDRDVGAVAQELYIDQGAQKIWSSDTCSDANQSEVKTISPGIEREYVVTWNGHTATKCQGTLAAGPIPAAGVYQIRARLSTKISDPVSLAVVA